MQASRALYELQKFDLGILRHRKRLDAIQAELTDNVAVQDAEQALAQAEQVLKPLQVQNRDLELQLQSTQSKLKNTEERLYSGAVKNPKELQEMQAEIDALKRWSSELENRSLEALLEVESAQAQVQACHTNLAAILADSASETADLLNEKRQLEAEILDFQAKRDTLAPTIAAEALALYEDLRPQKAHQAVALLTKDENCAICGIQQRGTVAKEIRRGDTIIQCLNCKRILVYI